MRSAYNNTNVPDGFHILSRPDGSQPALVKVYELERVRSVAFGAWDGAAIMPLNDILDDSVFVPANIEVDGL